MHPHRTPGYEPGPALLLAAPQQRTEKATGILRVPWPRLYTIKKPSGCGWLNMHGIQACLSFGHPFILVECPGEDGQTRTTFAVLKCPGVSSGLSGVTILVLKVHASVLPCSGVLFLFDLRACIFCIYPEKTDSKFAPVLAKIR